MYCMGHKNKRKYLKEQLMQKNRDHMSIHNPFPPNLTFYIETSYLINQMNNLCQMKHRAETC